MKTKLFEHLKGLEFGTPQTFNNLTVVPLTIEKEEKLKYISLKKALADNLIEISEIDESGHVPELKVKNKSDEFILIIDGDQFIGAKQNRIINASILIDRKAETIINVACVEEGRWSYKSKHFSGSDFMLQRNIRQKKMNSVHNSLKKFRAFEANQGEIWDEVHLFQSDADFCSPTSSMDETYKAKEKELKEVSQSFSLQPNQRGMIVFVDNKISGFEYISNEQVFSEYFEKILNSYSATAIFKEQTENETVDFLNESKSFLKNLGETKENKYKSLGIGDDLRLENKNTQASALVHDNEVLHLVGFSLDSDGKNQRRTFY